MFIAGKIQLKSNAKRILHYHYPWAYSNEVTHDQSLPAGSWVTLESEKGTSIGYGYYNPHSLIAFRIFERQPFTNETNVREEFFSRLDKAFEIRRTAYRDQMQSGEMGHFSFRLCFGESDQLPGLIIDLYETGEVGTPIRGCAVGKQTHGCAVVQCHAAGADYFVQWLQEWLAKLNIRSGVIRNDIDVRRRENVQCLVSEWGVLPEQIYALEGGVRFFIQPKTGQKTGYFYDHRDNRAALTNRVKLKKHCSSVLDCFSYIGSWGLQILKKNPHAHLTAVDSSTAALEQLKEIARVNGLANRVEVVAADIFKAPPSFSQPFDVVICDPPSLTSSAKQHMKALKAYEKCFTKALQWLHADGLIAFSSCSYHVTWDEFLNCITRSTHKIGSDLQLTYFGSQALDHPVLSSLIETRYLKCVFGSRV